LCVLCDLNGVGSSQVPELRKSDDHSGYFGECGFSNF
jgi:hypothetical protein